LSVGFPRLTDHQIEELEDDPNDNQNYLVYRPNFPEILSRFPIPKPRDPRRRFQRFMSRTRVKEPAYPFKNVFKHPKHIQLKFARLSAKVFSVNYTTKSDRDEHNNTSMKFVSAANYEMLEIAMRPHRLSKDIIDIRIQQMNKGDYYNSLISFVDRYSRYSQVFLAFKILDSSSRNMMLEQAHEEWLQYPTNEEQWSLVVKLLQYVESQKENYSHSRVSLRSQILKSITTAQPRVYPPVRCY
jgi:hypothetical protein